MALWHPFTPKQVGKGREGEKIKIIVLFRSYSTRNRKFKKKAKVFKKLKNTITPSFQAKIGWKRLRTGKKKLTFCFVHARREIEN